MKLLKKKGFIIDIDGVIARGQTPIMNAIEAVEELREMGKKIIFVSNNSTRSRRIMMDRFRSYGIKVNEEELLIATYATARLISREKRNARVYTTGEDGLKEELKLAGIKIVDYKNAEYLVVGSNRGINFEIMTKALRLALNKNIRYIAVNPDKIFPAEDGPIPGTGMIIGALYWMSGRKPDVIVGKPSKIIMEEALKILKLNAEDVVVIGDQIDVDVLAGKRINATTVLVLSGVTTKDNLNRKIEELGIRPDYILKDLSDILKY